MVRRLSEEYGKTELAGGEYNLVWDGRDIAGIPLTCGVYLYRIEMKRTDGSGRFTEIKKMIKIR